MSGRVDNEVSPDRQRAPEAAVLGIRFVAPAVGGGDSGNGKNQGAGNDKKDLVISGSVSGLYPGSTRQLALELRNDNNFPVEVTSIDVAVADASPGCPAATLRADGFRGSATVASNSSSTQVLDVRMSNGATDACKNATFPLTYTAKAVKP
ncbi:MAG: hypothetical protein M3P53_02455 [Actinomycetota bacterium]|nr:hypothetical protein [Actinomycetota bacterium]